MGFDDNHLLDNFSTRMQERVLENYVGLRQKSTEEVEKYLQDSLIPANPFLTILVDIFEPRILERIGADELAAKLVLQERGIVGYA